MLEQPQRLDVYGWCADRTACGLLRVELPLLALRDRGLRTAFSGEALPEVQPRVLVGQRVCMPAPSQTWQRLAANAKRTTKLVAEADDDLIEVDPSSPAYPFYGSPDVQERIRAWLRVADEVTVTTEPLAEAMRRYTAAQVHVIPNYLPGWLLQHERPRRADAGLTVGWGGSNTHRMDWEQCADQVRRFFARTRPGVELHLMGTGHEECDRKCDATCTCPCHQLRLPVGRTRYSPWIGSVPEYWRAIDYDVMLCPLRPHQFNKSKCLDAATRITTRRGVVPIGEAMAGDQVWHGEKWLPLLATERTAPRPGFMITTHGGYRVKLTPEHRMLVNGQWTTADQIRVGDTMAMEPEAVGPTECLRIPFPAVHHKNTTDVEPLAFADAEDGPKVDITPRWGRFFGAYVGDGSCGQATTIQISCDGQDQDWIDLLMDDLRHFGLNPRTETITTFSGEAIRRRAVRVSSSPLLRMMQILGLAHIRENGRFKRTVRVPEVIWRSPKDVIAEFLAAYFEADGHCTDSGIDAVSKDEQFARDIHRLLLLFGIEARLLSRRHVAQTGVGGIYWHVNLRRAAADVFAKEIGFRSARKRARLESITTRPHSNAYRPMAWKQAVTEIEPCFVEPVDIQVEGEVFAAAGLVSHNSSLRVLEAAMLGIPVVASDYGPYAEFVQHGVTGLLVRRDHEWAQHLRALVEDEAMRTEMGAAARRQAAAWTLEGHVDDWAKVLAP